MSDTPRHPDQTLPGVTSFVPPAGELPGSHAETTAFDSSASSSHSEKSGLSERMPRTTEVPLPEAFGRYRIIQLLGRGGMGSVYLAHDSQLDRPVALKIPRLETDRGGKLITRFLREARAVALLNHPNICPVFDVGQHEGVHFLAMAYVKGKPLSQFAEPGKLQPERAIALTVYKVALALEEAHAKGILHRDLKPANILVDHRGEPIVMDFGLSHRLSDEAQSRLTQEGTVIGTPAYMAPEQIDGKHKIGPATDVYSLGVVMYELLTGRCPFEGSMVSVIGQVLHTDPQPVTELRAGISPTLAAICAKAMHKDPAQRYASMKELATALGAHLKGKQTTAVVGATQMMPARQVAIAPRPEPATSLDALLTAAEAQTLGGGANPSLLNLPLSRSNSLNTLWFVIPAGIGVAVLVGVVGATFWRSADREPVVASAPPMKDESAARSLLPIAPSSPPLQSPATKIAPRVEYPTTTAEADKPILTAPATAEPMSNESTPAPEPAPAAESVDPSIPRDESPVPPDAGPPEDRLEATPAPSPPDDDKRPADPPGFPPEFPRPPGEGPPHQEIPGATVAEKFKVADRNHDGFLDRTELPLHIIRRADVNRDLKVSESELRRAVERIKDRLFAPPSEAELKRLPPPGFRPPKRGPR